MESVGDSRALPLAGIALVPWTDPRSDGSLDLSIASVNSGASTSTR
jgi:hypothetical protein